MAGKLAGKFTAATGSTDGVECEAGKYSTTAGNDAASDCEECEAGKYSATSGNDAASNFVECEAGKYHILLNGAAGCSDCDAGKPDFAE